MHFINEISLFRKGFMSLVCVFCCLDPAIKSFIKVFSGITIFKINYAGNFHL
jgi:hypothetical protein